MASPLLRFDFNTLEQLCIREERHVRPRSGLFMPTTVYTDGGVIQTTQQSQDAGYNAVYGAGYVNPTDPRHTGFMIGATLMRFYRRIRRQPSSRCAAIISELVSPLDHTSVEVFTLGALSRDPLVLFRYLVMRRGPSPPPRVGRHPNPQPAL
jgi:hypothetical protein